MEIIEVPFPALNPGCVMVRNHYSVISAGTEGKTVIDARKGYAAKAKSRQKEVRQVIDMIKTNGLLSTWKTVMNKLEAPAPLGYSTAGEVIAVGEGVTGFRTGDYVACSGASASHADVISVPANLCCRVPEGVRLDEAAFTTIAAIALQGIRQADLRTGENAVIIGTGLIGLLTAHMLEASGIIPICVDISREPIDFARKTGLKQVFDRNQEGLQEQIMQLTHGHGTDAILITAGTSSTDPVEFAGVIARKKARVVIVGAVPTGFSRLHYYRKELDLRMSCSYGPGRHDLNYEEKGMDYPIGYVRFTQQRNMQTCLQLLADRKMQIHPLITHRFRLNEAPDAYAMIVDKSEHFAGIVIEYDTDSQPAEDVSLRRESGFHHGGQSRTADQSGETVESGGPAHHAGHSQPAEPAVGLIGAGNFAQNILLPQMKGRCRFVTVASGQGHKAIYVGKKYGFSDTCSDADKLIADPRINTLFVLTRHNTHAGFILKGIHAGKHVFTEKPLAMTREELEEIRQAREQRVNDGQRAGGRQPVSGEQRSRPDRHLMVGFNRRFSPAVQQIKKLFVEETAKSITIRVNAGVLPADHWVNDPDVGGGRIIGEACHFIDLAMHLAGSPIRTVSAVAMDDPNRLDHTVVINLAFENGSIASVSYFSNGNKSLPKEYIEVYCGGTVATIDDFRKLTVYGKTVKKRKLKGQDKGHAGEIAQFLDSIRRSSACPVPFEESYLSTLATFGALESLRSGRTIRLSDCHEPASSPGDAPSNRQDSYSEQQKPATDA